MPSHLTSIDWYSTEQSNYHCCSQYCADQSCCQREIQIGFRYSSQQFQLHIPKCFSFGCHLGLNMMFSCNLCPYQLTCATDTALIRDIPQLAQHFAHHQQIINQARATALGLIDSNSPLQYLSQDTLREIYKHVTQNFLD